MFKYISHRGNLRGPHTCKENHAESIISVLNKGYDCEIDVWCIDKSFFLGHDKPEYYVDREFLLQKGLWIHCKNVYALLDLKEDANCFMIHQDEYTLTSQGYVWASPDVTVGPACVIMKEDVSDLPSDIYGVCSDYIEFYSVERESPPSAGGDESDTYEGTQ